MLRASKTKKHRESGIKRPVPEGLTPFIDPLRMHPPRQNLKASTSAPIQTLNSTNLGRGATTRSVAPGQVPLVDVGAKVEGMLMAHEVLKGNDNNIRPSTPTSKKSRWFSKFMDKVNIPSKRETADTSQRKLPPVIVVNPIETIHMRFNQNRNLDRARVQHLSSDSILPKQVANGGQSVVATRSPPNCHAETLQKLDPISSVSSEESVEPFPQYAEPFIDETDFDDNLETGVLKEVPCGSSTPRPTIDRRVVVDAFGSPQRIENVQSAQDHDSHRASYFSDSDSSTGSDDDDSVADIMTHSTKKNGQIRLAVPESFQGEICVKKHPSPGIEWFDSVDAAITSYGRLQPEGASKSELDELAETLNGLGSLVQRDNNRLISTTSTINHCDEPVTPDVSVKVAIPQRPSRIPRAPKLTNRQPCAMKHLRPNDERADEADELL